MENFPQSFEPVGSDSILEQFIQLKNYVNDALSMFEDNVNEILDSNDFVQTKVQNLTNQGHVLQGLFAQLNTKVEENTDTIDEHTTNISSLNQQSARALKTPIVAPTETELVGINDNNSQVNISVGDGLKLINGAICGISIKELWKNPDTSAYFVATTVTLNSDDYDYLLIIWGSNRDEILYENSCIVKKGNNISMNGVIASSSSPYIYALNRSAVRNSDTSYTFDECYQSTPSGTNTSNKRLIPKYIYGIKVV